MIDDREPNEQETKIFDLEEKVTILKAERDQARRDHDEALRVMFGLLALIHRDGGHYTEQHGVVKSLEDAKATIVSLHAKFDTSEELT